MMRKGFLLVIVILGLLTAVFLKPPTTSQADEPAPAATAIPQIPTLNEKTEEACARLDEKGVGLSGAEELWLRQVCERPLPNQPQSAIPQNQPASLLALGPDVPVNDPSGDSGDSRTQSTTTLAVNQNSGTICSAYIDSFHGIEEGRGFVGFSRSTDGGASFTDQGDLEMPPVNYGNPSMVWRTQDSNFYLSAPLGGYDGMGIWHSADDCQSFDFYGQTEMRWSYGVDDMNILTADNNATSPYYGRLYLTFQGEYGQIMLSYSDNGLDWQGDITLSNLTSYTDKVQTPWAAVAPNGDVYVSWVTFIGDLYNPPWYYNINLVQSSNGGQTFSPVSSPVVNALVPNDTANTCMMYPWEPQLPALNGNIRYYPAPPQLVVGADGTLHLVYSRDPDSYGVGDVINVYYRRSTDNGATWDAEIQLNDDDTITDQFFPTISVNEYGRLVSTWYDRRNDPANNFFYETFMAVSTDNGETWESNQQVSDFQSPVILDPAITLCYHGFYDQQVQQGDNVYIQWADDRTGDSDVYFESVPFPPDFTLSATPSSQSVCTAAGSTVYDLKLTAVQNFAQAVTLSASGQPGGSSITFSSNPVIPPSTPTMTVGNLGSVAPGNYDITVTGTAVTLTHSADVVLNMADVVPGTAALLSPANGADDVPALATFSWTAVSSAISYTLEVATDPGFSNILISEATDQTSLTPATYLETGQTYYWRVTAHNGCGNTTSAIASFESVVAPPILLVDNDSDAPDVTSYYTETLDSLGYSYDLWDTQLGANQPTENDLAAYDIVIWYSGDMANWQGQVGPTLATEAALASYLNQDNCFLMSSMGYLNSNITAFPSQYLGLRAHSYPYPEYASVTGDWVVFGGLGPYNMVYPYAPPQVRGVFLNGVGQPAFTSAPHIAGSNIQTDFRSSYWGFPFEAVDGAANREEVMETAVSWCLNGVTYGSIAGTVTDADYSWAIPGATITAHDGTLSTSFSSDDDGDYSGDLRTGTYTVTVAASDYQSQTIQVTIQDSETTVEDFALQGSSLDYAPAAIEDTVTLGDVVTHTLTLTSSGPLPAEVTLSPYVTLDGRIYTIDSGRLQVSFFHPDTPEVVEDLAPVSSVSLAGDFMGDDFSQVYAIYENDPNVNGDETFVSIDTTTGAVTTISDLPTPPGIEFYTGMSYNPADGQMYVVSASCDWFAPSTTLYTIDVLTGELAEIGPIFTAFGSPCLVSLAFDPAGNLYANDLNGAFGQIDLNTNLFSTIGMMNVIVGGNTGLDWDPVTNQLYLSVYDAVLTQNELRLVDVATGQTTLVGVMGTAVPGIPSQVYMGWIAFAAAPADWVQPTPTQLTVPTNGTATVDVALDTRSLYRTGDYTARLGFLGSFVNVVPSVPITMHLECPTCGYLDGNILDAWSGDPVIANIQITNTAGVNIALRGDSYDVAVQPGQYTISANAEGYFEEEVVVTAVTGSTTSTDLHLIPQAGLLSFSPASLTAAAEIGQMVTRTVTVSNSGTIPMTFTVRMDNQDVPVALRNATLSAITGAAQAPDSPQLPPLQIQAYGLDLGAGVHNDARLAWFDLTTPAVLNHSNVLINHDSYGGDFWGNEFGTLYAYEEYRLVAIDTHTGEKTIIGGLPYTSEWANYTGMAYDLTTTTMYGTLGMCDFSGGGTTELLTIDVETAATVFLGTIANATCIRDIAVDDLGTMYGVDVGNDVLVRIDPATVTAEIIGSIGFDVAYWAQGLDWDSATNQLYFVGIDFLFGTSWELFRMDLQTGEAMEVGALPGTAVFSGLAIAAETATWAHLPTGEMVIPNGMSATFDVVFDASQLYRAGDYEAEIIFDGTFINDVPTLPVAFQVACTDCGTLDGALTDTLTGDPIYGRLHITGPNNFNVTLTNRSSYNLTVRPGDYTITAESVGYVSAMETVTAVPNSTITTDFALTPIAAEVSFSPGSFTVNVPVGTALTQTLTLNNEGNAPFPFTVLDADTTVEITSTAVLTSCGDADAFGYACIDSHAPGGPVYNWVDISSSGTDMGLTGNNDFYFPINLPFRFSYYGESYSQVAVSSYGQIFFEDAYPDDMFVNQSLPVSMTTGVNSFIVPYWSNLRYEPWNNPRVYYEVQGIAPHRRLVIQFENVTSNWTSNITLQTILFEDTGNILMQYATLNGADGSNATIGIQGDEYTATQYGYNTAVLSDNLAICYVHPDSSNTDCHLDVPTADWLHQTPMTGTVAGGSTADIAIVFDATTITQTGTYTGYLYLGNTYAEPMIVPVLMNVVTPPPPSYTLYFPVVFKSDD